MSDGSNELQVYNNHLNLYCERVYATCFCDMVNGICGIYLDNYSVFVSYWDSSVAFAGISL